MEVCFSMPCAFKKPLNPLEMYSPPLSDRNTLILCSDCVSTNALNSLNFSKHSPLDFNKYTHTFLEKSTMYVTKYLAPPKDVVLMGPHTSACTISKGLVARIPPSLGNGLRCCFPSMLLKIRGEMLNIRGEIAHFKAHRSHKYVNNAWRECSNSPPTLLFIPFPVPPH